MLRFRQMKSPQKFSSVHANVNGHFNLQRHLVDQRRVAIGLTAPSGELARVAIVI